MFYVIAHCSYRKYVGLNKLGEPVYVNDKCVGLEPCKSLKDVGKTLSLINYEKGIKCPTLKAATHLVSNVPQVSMLRALSECRCDVIAVFVCSVNEENCIVKVLNEKNVKDAIALYKLYLKDKEAYEAARRKRRYESYKKRMERYKAEDSLPKPKLKKSSYTANYHWAKGFKHLINKPSNKIEFENNGVIQTAFVKNRDRGYVDYDPKFNGKAYSKDWKAKKVKHQWEKNTNRHMDECKIIRALPEEDTDLT